MEKVITGDNSTTFRNKEYDECYHTKSGAIEEAFEKYAKLCKLKDGMKVLDVCFGIGYNSLAAISLANVEIVEGGAILKQDEKELKVENLTHPEINFSVISLSPAPLELDKQIEGLKRLELRIPVWTIEGDKTRIIIRLAGN